MNTPSLLDSPVERYTSFSEFRKDILCEIADDFNYLAWVIREATLYLPEDIDDDDTERIQEFLLPVFYEWLDRGLIRIGGIADDASVINWSPDPQKLIDRLKQEWDDHDASGDPNKFAFALTIYIETTEKGNEYIFEQGWPIHELHRLYPRYLERQKKKEGTQSLQIEPPPSNSS